MEITRQIAERQTISLNAQDNLSKLIQYDRITNATALVLGKLLKENVDNDYWKQLSYESFSDFVAQAGFSFTRRTAYNYIDLWDMFEKWKIDYEKFVEIPYSKLLKIKSVITQENLEEWLCRARELSRTDLEAELLDSGVVAEEGHNGDLGGFRPAPKIFKHSHCGKWIIEVAPSDCCKRWMKCFVRVALKELGIDKENYNLLNSDKYED